MIPELLKIKGFLSYRNEAVLDFNQIGDVILITGDNGHGKSSIIDAIVYAFFGIARGITRNKQDVVNIDENLLSIELIFREKGKRYRIKRTYRKDKETTGLILEEFDDSTGSFKNISEGKIVDTEEKIKKVLGFNYETFIGASFILQGAADFFTTKTPAEKAELLREMLGLDIYERAKEIAKTRKKEVLTTIELLENEIKAKEESLLKEEDIKIEKERLDNEISTHSSKIETLKAHIDELNKKREEILRLKERLESKNREREVALKRIVNLQKEKENLQKNLEEFTEIINEREEITKNFEILKEIRLKKEKESEKEKEFIRLKNEKTLKEKEIESKVESKTKEFDIHENRLKEIQDEITSSKEKIDKYEIFIGNTIKQREEALLQKDVINGKIEELKTKLDGILLKEERLKNTENSIRDFEKNLKDSINKYEKERQEILDKINKEREELGQIENSIAEGEKRLNTLKDDRTELQSKVSRKEAIQKEIEEILKKISGFEKNLELETEKINLISESDTAKCPLCGSPLTEEHRHTLINEFEENTVKLKNQIGELREKKSTLEKTLKELDSFSQKLSQTDILIAKIEESLTNLKEKKVHLEDQLNEETLRLKEIEAELKKLKEDLALNSAKEEELLLLREEVKSKDKIQNDLTKRQEELGKIELQLQKIESSLIEASTNKKNEIEKLTKLQEEEALEREAILKLRKELEEKTFIENELNELRTLQGKIELLNFDEHFYNELKEKENALKIYEEKFTKLAVADARITELEKQIEKVGKDIENTNEEIKEIEQKIQEISENLKNFDYVEKTFENESLNLENAQKVLNELLIQRAKLEENLKELENMKIEIKEKTDTIERNKKRLEALTALEEILGRNGVQLSIISDYLPHLENEVNRFLQRLTEGRMYLKFLTVKADKNSEKPTLDIIIYDRGVERRYELFSGGEKFRIDFSLRLGIAKFLAQIRNATLETLVIDEGFGSQDAKGRTNILEEINNIKSDFKKILVISHLNEIKENFPNQIRVVKDEYGSRIEIP